MITKWDYISTPFLKRFQENCMLKLHIQQTQGTAEEIKIWMAHNQSILAEEQNCCTLKKVMLFLLCPVPVVCVSSQVETSAVEGQRKKAVYLLNNIVNMMMINCWPTGVTAQNIIFSCLRYKLCSFTRKLNSVPFNFNSRNYGL